MGAAGLVGATLAGSLLLADHLHHSHDNPVPAPPPPPQGHHHNGAVAAGLTGAAVGGGLALAEHQYHQHNNPPQPPPPQHHNGGVAAGLTAAAAGAGGVMLADQYLQHHNNQPPANLPPPPVDANTAIPILPVPINNPPLSQPPQPGAPVMFPMPMSPVALEAGDVVGGGPGQEVLPPMVGPGPSAQQPNNGGAFSANASAAAGFVLGSTMAAAQGYDTRPQSQPPPPPVVTVAAHMADPPVLLDPLVIEPPPQPQIPPAAPVRIPPPLPGPSDPFQDPAQQQPFFPQHGQQRLDPTTGPPMLQGFGPLIQPNQPGQSQVIPIAQASQFRAAPAVGVASAPVASGGVEAAGGRGDELWHFFPFGPAAHMVIGGVDMLFGRDPHRQ